MLGGVATWGAAAGLVSLLCVVALAWAGGVPRGTTPEELSGKSLPEPQSARVAVLPVWSVDGRDDHVRWATLAIYVLLQRHGFKLISWKDALEATLSYSEAEPGEPLRRQDACKIAAGLQADWVVYGQLHELEAYWKESFLTRRRKAKCTMKLVVADVHTGEVVYWHHRSEVCGGHGSAKANFQERNAVAVTVTRALQPLLRALPEHHVEEGGVVHAGDWGELEQRWVAWRKERAAASKEAEQK